jgi:cysteinyl-tRNA synthetase
MTHALRLFNTLSGAVEPFAPAAPPEVRMYVCGPTVYSRAHIGNFRTFVLTDVLRRTMKHLGWRVLEAMNMTDVEDRIIRFAQDAGTDLKGFTAPHVTGFEEDMGLLRMERPEVFPKATDHVAEMVELIARLTARGHTYTVDGSVYFRISSFAEYGRLSRLDVAGIKAGARVDNDRYEKEDARDFVLWKVKTDEPEWAQWDAPFGRGRPGWHIECSAMSMKYLGETFDLHCGGVDLIFPHHENEIAQSTGGTGKPFARHWTHVEHLLIEDETMSKSKGNVYTIPDLVARGHKPEAIRYLLCQAHYRKKLNFTFEGLQHATAALERIQGLVRRLDEVEREGVVAPEIERACERWGESFSSALCDDLNTPEALAAVHGLVGEGNSLLAEGKVTRSGAARLRAAIASMDSVFGVLLPAGVETLTAEQQSAFDERQEARQRREYQRADAARARLEALGVVLEDTPKGTRWRRVR